MRNILLLFMIAAPFAFSQNVKVTDYKVPISQAKTLRFDGSWNWAQNGNNVTANNGSGTLLFRTFYSSLPLAWFLDIDANGNKNRSDYSHNIQVDGSFRKYVWPKKDWFGFSRIRATHGTGYNQIASDLTTGGGYGRYINATALAKAVRIEEHLINDNVITEYLPKETMIEIANIIEREDEYRDKYGEVYETYWFDAIEEQIERTGLLNEESVGSIGILRIRQVLFGVNERVNQRYYGWDVTAGVLFPISTHRDTIDPGEPNLALGARYSFPLSWRIQINSGIEVFTPMNELFFKFLNSRLSIDFIYELSNRINFVSGYKLGLLKPQFGSAVANHSLATSFWYYIENNIYLTISGDYSKQGNNPKIIATRVGLQYNLF